MRAPSSAAVLAVIALGVALAGPASSSVDRLITGADVKNRSLSGVDVKKNSLTGAEVRNGSLTAADLSTAARAALSRPGATGPQGPEGARGPEGPQGAPGPRGPAGSDATVDGVAAGGDLTGTFPNPQLGPGAVGADEIASSAVTTGKLDVGAVTGEKLAGGSVTLTKLGFTEVTGLPPVNPTIPAGDCFRSSIVAAFPAGSLVLQRAVPGPLPAGVFLPAYTVHNDGVVDIVLCNANSTNVGPFTAEIALRVLS